ncbi:MAG TPA: metallopeptidase TldD-related protein [Ktedonobacterales bacterium]
MIEHNLNWKGKAERMALGDETTQIDATGDLALGRLAEALAAISGADAWQAHARREDEAQLYLIGEKVEARRNVVTERTRIAIHNSHASHNPEPENTEPVAGSAAITLLPEEVADSTRLATRLREAVAMAALTDNRPYDLPAPPAGGYPAVEVSDPALAGDLGAVLDDLRSRMETEVARHPDVRISSAEFFATRGQHAIRTSAGVRAAYPATSLFVDFVLIASDGAREAEFHGELSRRRVEDLALEETVEAYVRLARHTLDATAPEAHRGPVILSGRAVADLFNAPLVFERGPYPFHTSAQAAFQGVSRFTAGQSITPEPARGDKLSLWSDSARPFGNRAAPLDDEGIPANTTQLIADGVFQRPWADARYATYLGVPATGAFGNIRLGLGSRTLPQLRLMGSRPIYEIVAFSLMNPDLASGDFVAEIKLGYRHDERGSAPIKGGSVSGNLFAAFGDAYFSSELFSDGAYDGPAAIRFGELTLGG